MGLEEIDCRRLGSVGAADGGWAVDDLNGRSLACSNGVVGKIGAKLHAVYLEGRCTNELHADSRRAGLRMVAAAHKVTRAILYLKSEDIACGHHSLVVHVAETEVVDIFDAGLGCTEISLQFFPHVLPQRVSELAGLLSPLGLVKVFPPSTVEIEVNRQVRVGRVQRTLNNWQIAGWIDEFRES